VEEQTTAQAKETTSSLRARDVGATTTVRTFTAPAGKDGDSTTGPARTLSGNRLGQAALRREQREQLESNHHASRRDGRRGRSETSQAVIEIEEMAVRL
jgi:hypothetical protein